MKHRRHNAVYQYLDYRAFLRDEISHLREASPNFSYRAFNAKAGFKSPGHLQQIARGQLNVGHHTMHRLCKGLGLSTKEADFFGSLVHFNQAKTHQDRDKFYNELLHKCPPQQPHMMGEVCYRIFQHWYYVVILEMARMDNFCEVASWIARRLQPAVSEVKVRKALEDLQRLGLLIRDTNGKLVPSDIAYSTPEAVHSVAIMKFQQQLTTRAVQALEHDRIEDKEFITMTSAVSQQTFKQIKEILKACQSDIRSLILSDANNGDADQVAHVNLQLFSLTQEPKS